MNIVYKYIIWNLETTGTMQFISQLHESVRSRKFNQSVVPIRGLLDDPIGDAMENTLSRVYAEGALRAEREMIAQGVDAITLSRTRTQYYADIAEYKEFLTKGRDTVVTLVTNMVEKVYTLLAVGISEGLSQEQLKEIIYEAANGKITKFMAKRIANTETIRAYNLGMKKRCMAYGMTYWQWVAARETEEALKQGIKGDPDSKTCGICRQLHGAIRRVGEPFTFGGAFNQAIIQPPDPHPNCRCMVSPVFTEEVKERSKRREVIKKGLGKAWKAIRRIMPFEEEAYAEVMV